MEDTLSYLNLDDSSELHQAVNSVSLACQNRLLRYKPEEANGILRKNFSMFAELGLSQLSISTEKGGLGYLPSQIAAIVFELARHDLGPAIYIPVHLMVSGLIAKWDTADDHSKTLERLGSGVALGAFCLTEAAAGSDAGSLCLKAEHKQGSFVLNGEKIYITSAPDADFFLVFARDLELVDKTTSNTSSISAFVLPSVTKGISIGPSEKKCGCETAPIASVSFNNVTVPSSTLLGKRGMGFKIALSGLEGGRINIAAAACGISYSAITKATAYLKERQQFGKKLSEFQGLQFILADMTTKHLAAVSLLKTAATRLSQEASSTNTSASPSASKASSGIQMMVSAAKCFATDICMQNCVDAVQLFGGAGYLREYEVEGLMRDAKMLQIVEGTNQIQRIIISRSLFEQY